MFPTSLTNPIHIQQQNRNSEIITTIFFNTITHTIDKVTLVECGSCLHLIIYVVGAVTTVKNTVSYIAKSDSTIAP